MGRLETPKHVPTKAHILMVKLMRLGHHQEEMRHLLQGTIAMNYSRSTRKGTRRQLMVDTGLKGPRKSLNLSIKPVPCPQVVFNRPIFRGVDRNQMLSTVAITRCSSIKRNIWRR